MRANIESASIFLQGLVGEGLPPGLRSFRPSPHPHLRGTDIWFRLRLHSFELASQLLTFPQRPHVFSRRIVSAFLVALITTASSCKIERVHSDSVATAPDEKTELWVYTSMYRHVLDAMDPWLKTQLPNVEIKYFQAGSEKIATKLEAELSAGGTPCEVLMTSDPFIYARLKNEIKLKQFVPASSLQVPAALRDVDGFFTAARVSTMVMIRHKDVTAFPLSFLELTDSRYTDSISFPDPLTSGTALTWIHVMNLRYGNQFSANLRKNLAKAAGGNSAVLQKVEGKESAIGVVLLENALAAQAKKSPIEIIWPGDKAVLIPGYAAILSTAKHQLVAQEYLDAIFSTKGQTFIQQGLMHAGDPRLDSPGGTEDSVGSLVEHNQILGPNLSEDDLNQLEETKKKFSEAFSK
jgi:iron(III) transport system substrate-binding protein